MNPFNGEAVVVTGAGRGLGREHARLLASLGARVVVNDVGAGPDGHGVDPSVAEEVANELRHGGFEAVASSADVRTMSGAQELLTQSLDVFGSVSGVVNNAGILQDRMFVNMSEQEWDEVITGQLKNTFAVTRTFAGHWRDLSKAGNQPNASIVNVSSTSGLIGQVGQSNYGAAKAGVASLSVILAQELARYGVRVNAIVPVARTRMTEEVPGIKDLVAKPDDPDAFDVYHPSNVSPIVAYLLSPTCRASGKVFYAKGGEIREMLGWHYGAVFTQDHRYSVDELHTLIDPIL
jgi:NAD(P)-dependent dehydrogenase (short-subunit alcohol dehydrogenase family)